MKKLLSVIISIVLIFCLTGCNNEVQSPEIDNNDQTSNSQKLLSLAYCFNDVINPYKALTEVNQKLSTLIYDSLVTLDGNFNIVHLLASNISMQNKTCVVTIKDVFFTDGTPLTASDVIYSFQAAKDSGNYKELASIVSTISADNQKTIVFSLTKDDPFFAALLTFPIIKYDTADLKTDNNLPLPPIGCGKYIPDFENNKLVRNENYHSQLPNPIEINLLNIPDTEALTYAVSTGKISVWQDTYKGGETLTANGGTFSVTSNSLIYIGINEGNDILKISQMRHALSAIIDRSVVCDEIYDGYAIPSSGIYNPSWSAILNLQENSTKANDKIFLANLEEIGYNNLDAFGFRTTNDGKPFSFRLIYCNNTESKVNLANAISNQLSKVGIKVTSIGLEYEEYLSALHSKDFDLYIAETIINNNMDISSLVSSNGGLNFGGAFDLEISQDDDLSTDTDVYTSFDEILTAYYNGTAELYDIINMFNLQMPLIPICYKSNALSYQIGVNVPENFSPTDPYYVIKDCTIN